MNNQKGKLTAEQRSFLKRYDKIPTKNELKQVRSYKESKNRMVEMEVL
jgi:hypothetical protein